VSDARLEPDMSLPFPIEFMIRDTPRSHQSGNSKGKEQWRLKVGEIARTHAKTLREFYFLDQRPLAATIFYFPPTKMDGDVDNIVKLIVDGMIAIIYLDDQQLERVIVQKFRAWGGIRFPLSDSRARGGNRNRSSRGLHPY
jgi:Holliday junction resolvase RusA-like endonuclease